MQERVERDRLHGLEALDVCVDCGHGTHDRRVVNEDVELSEPVADGGQKVHHLVSSTDVRLHRHRVSPQGAHGGDRRVGLRCGMGVVQDRGATGRTQPTGDGLAQSLRPARHQRDFPVELKIELAHPPSSVLPSE